MNDFSRVTGIVSNFDTDGIVKAMLSSEQLKIDRTKGEAQLLEWKRDGYREMASMLKGFQSKYFDLLNRESNLRLSSTYSIYKANVLLGGEKNQSVSARIEGSASFEKIEINEISQLAKAETWQANSKLKEISGNVNISDLNTALSAGGGALDLEIQVDGLKKTINFETSYSDLGALRDDLQAKVNNIFGDGVVDVSLQGGELTIDGNSHKIEVSSIDASVSTAMNIAVGDRNYFDSEDTLENLLGITAPVHLKLQGADGKLQEVDLTPGLTMDQTIELINKGRVAKIELDPITGKFSLTSNKTGRVNGITMSDNDTKNFFAALGIDDTTRIEGKNAKVVINGQSMSLTENKISLDGAQITFNNTHAASDGPIEVTKTFDSDSLYDKFKGFVEKYNELVDKLKKSISEKRSYNYRPLTDEQKEDMEKEEIEKWEKEAKRGLFRSDGILEKILSEARRAFTTKVGNLDISMREVGITFTSNYNDGGKLEIDKTKFEEGLKTYGEDAIKLFTSKSDKSWNSGNDVERFNESGIMERMNDIINNNISTTKLISGARGALIEKAGAKGFSSENTAELSLKIRAINKRVDKMMDALLDRENKYYLKFARLEKALAQINSQSTAFAGLLGGS